MAGTLQARAQQRLSRNAVALNRTRAPEKQWFNIPAKIEAGKRIADEEKDLAWADGVRPHNNAQDAMRHARWSKRMAEEIDPAFAWAAGVYHEGENLWDEGKDLWRGYKAKVRDVPVERDVPDPRQVLAESIMDLRNNHEGLQAAREGRPVAPDHLQTRPLRPLSRTGPKPVDYAPTYKAPPQS